MSRSEEQDRQNGSSRADETTSLLSHGHDGHQIADPAEAPKHNSFWHRHILILIAIWLIAGDGGDSLLDAPKTEIFEAVACHNYYRDHGTTTGDGSELSKRCKINAVQDELALILGLIKFIECIPMILFAIPLAHLADRVGRSRVLFLSQFGMFLANAVALTIASFPDVFPLRLVLATTLLSGIGGGTAVASSIAFAVLTDISTPESRANLFFVAFAIDMLAQSLGRIGASTFMSKSVWGTGWAGVAALGLACFLTLLLPDTRRSIPRTSNSQEDAQDDPDDATKSSTWTQYIKDNLSHAHDTVSHDYRILLIFAADFFSALGAFVSLFILQYSAKRFDLSFAKANLINSWISIGQLIMLLLILPGITRLLLAYFKFSVFGKDLTLSLLSSSLFLIGSLLFGLGRVLPFAIIGATFFSFGIGNQALLRAMMTAAIPSNSTTLGHSIFTLVEKIGAALSGPLYAMLFKKGLRLSGDLIGLPFYVSATCFGIVIAILGISFLGRKPLSAASS